MINVGSTSFEYIASLFDDDRIQRKCAIVTDLDEQAIPSEHRLYKSTAQEKGQARKEKLSSLFNENNWVNCFYANTTFEIEFLDVNKENILTYVSPIIDDAFKDKNNNCL